MFTGIVETIGTVFDVTEHGAQSRLTVDASGFDGNLQHGESIAVNGVCLTVASHEGSTWQADVMRVTQEYSTLGALSAGDRVNLERAVRPDSRLGGHLVQGHVDGVTELVARDSQPEWDDLTFALPPALARYVAAKGSIALNGVSLTVATLASKTFTVSLIPTTLTDTTFGALTVGEKINVEVDVIAKYVERLMGATP